MIPSLRMIIDNFPSNNGLRNAEAGGEGLSPFSGGIDKSCPKRRRSNKIVQIGKQQMTRLNTVFPHLPSGLPK